MQTIHMYSCFNHHTTLSRIDLYKNGKCYCGEQFQSSGYLTEKNWHLLITCKVCHNLDLAEFDEATKKQMLEDSVCFNCLFWQEYVRRRQLNDTKCIVVDGHHYVICEDVSSEPRGHGGAKFIIELENGTKITTHNLWHQGDIPKYFRNILSDNAKFLKE